jgi:uncharacterized protein (TIGR02453 family)
MRAMTFQGWPDEALDFFDGLEADNSKTYWQAHKHVYETSVLAPMSELLEELAPEHGDAFKIFRPYRDMRFSKDKSPYKTEIAAVLGEGYVRLSADGLGAGSGMHMMDSGQLERYRKAVDADPSGSELKRVIHGINQRGIEVRGHDSLKSAPKGYQPDHPRIEMLRWKGLIAWQEWPVEPWLATAAAKDRVAGFFVATRPLNDWLAQHVGRAS